MWKKDYSKIEELNRRAFQSYKPTKRQVIELLETMASQTVVTDELVKLYAYFNNRPKPPKKATTVFEWVARAVSTDHEKRNFMCVVLVEKNRIVATDGRRIHIAENVDNMKPGKYSPDGTYICDPDSQDMGTFPFIDRVIERMSDPVAYWDVKPADLEAETETNRVFFRGIGPDNFDIAFDRQFIEQVSVNGELVTIGAHSPETAARLTPHDALHCSMYAVVMPMQVQ